MGEYHEVFEKASAKFAPFVLKNSSGEEPSLATLPLPKKDVRGGQYNCIVNKVQLLIDKYAKIVILCEITHVYSCREKFSHLEGKTS